MLLGLSEDAEVGAVLREVGVDDVERAVDARYPALPGPLSVERVKSYTLRVGTTCSPRALARSHWCSSASRCPRAPR